jgi:hypothetical protein
MTHTWEKRNSGRVLARKTEGRRPLSGAGRKWEVNIKMDLE